MTEGSGGLRLSVAVPFYNEGRANVRAFFEALLPVLDALCPGGGGEVVAVDDGSSDDTAEAILEVRAGDPRVKLVQLSRNFGHQVALSAALDYVDGDAVVAMDGDLQDPPEVLRDMVAKWREGYEVVYGRRERREGEGVGKRLPAKVFYRLLWLLSDYEIPLDTGDFRLMDRKVVEGLRRFGERSRFLRGLVAWMGFRQAEVRFVRSPRHGGEPKYTLRKLLGLAGNGVFSFSRKPLRLAAYLGVLCATAAFAYLGWVLVQGYFFRSEVKWGWYSLTAVVLFLGGMQLMCLGLLGEYVGRIYEEVKARPLYFVQAFHGEREEGGV